MLIAYVALSLAFLGSVMVTRPHHSYQILTHVADIIVISSLMYLSKGGVSPFFVLYTFILLAGTLRWGSRGTLVTTGILFALLVLLVYAAPTPHGGHIFEDQDFEWNRVIIRLTFLIVAGGMLACIAFSIELNALRIARLAAWPSPAASLSQATSSVPLVPALSHIAAVMQVPRLLVVWEQAEEPYVNHLSWSDSELHHQQDLGTNDWVDAQLSKTTFACSDLESRSYVTHQSYSSTASSLISDALAQRFGIRSFLTAPFSGTICTGRLFFLDRPNWTDGDLTLGDIIASRIGLELEHYALRTQVEALAAIKERARLGRDIHDGVLQTLTAIGLQLAAIASQTGDEMQRRLTALLQLLTDERGRVRRFVEKKMPPTVPPRDVLPIKEEMQYLIAKAKNLWDCNVSLEVRPADAGLPTRFCHEVDYILNEAVANSTRHGQASSVAIIIEKGPKQLALDIIDSGGGFAGISGSYQHSELQVLDIGPRSLRNRVGELRGTLSLTSSPNGTELHIQLPLQNA
jgi:signal transduction histidine kinase